MATIAEVIKMQITEGLGKAGLPIVAFSIDQPKELAHGDYATNVALILAKEVEGVPKDIADKLVPFLTGDSKGWIERVEIAPAGFINFFISERCVADTIANCKLQIDKFGWSMVMQDKKVMVEFAQPNPFKQFHIGHLMGTVMGECYSRLYESMGASVLRANYQGDVGVHVACAIYGMRERRSVIPAEIESLDDKVKFLGEAYAFGATQYKADPSAKFEIDELNKKVYQKSDTDINELYNTGKRWSLAHFEELYTKLGTSFDHLFFESEMAPLGLEIIAAHREVFEDSEGAVVFQGEQYGLHTRVFINSQGLPTYEAKELGLNKHKFDVANPDLSIVETANEINEYFRVLLKVLELVAPEVAKRTKHVSHGMMRLPDGKMSSRTGNVITGESLLSDLEEQVREKTEGREGLTDLDREQITSAVSVGAIKFSILKQAPGKDIIFDREKALSLEGDSGPYVQYAHTRAVSILSKAKDLGITPSLEARRLSGLGEVGTGNGLNELSRMLVRYPDVLAKSVENLAPQTIATYLLELASSFNSYYAKEKVIDEADKEGTASRLALVEAVSQVLKNGLWVLGIIAPDKM